MIAMPAQSTRDEFPCAEEAAEFVRSRTALRPQIAVVLGSGLGSFADELTNPTAIPYEDIPHFPKPTAEGHAGRLVIGKLGDVAIAAMQGRVHYYEGYSPAQVIFPIRVCARLGVRAAILTNAAGGINLNFGQGCLVVLRDHINLQVNPMVGPNDERFGPRFFDMSHAYDERFRKAALAQGNDLGMKLFEGVYAAMSGPSYETPAEIRYLRCIGADMVGMSTVSEVIAARHLGIRVLAISCVTNMAAGILDQPITHEEVLETAHRVRHQFVALLRGVLPAIAAELENT
jgi:purine-nucleoside phosphorylase